MPEIFPGFDPPDGHWSKMPHSFIETLYARNSLAEVKVILYVLRHTWGFQEYKKGRRITLDEFANGRRRDDGTRIDNGTGLCRNGVKAGIRKAVAHGFLVQEPDGRGDGGRSSHVYRLRMAESAVSASASGRSRRDMLGANHRHSEYQSLTPRVSEADMRSEKETKQTNYSNTIPEIVPRQVLCSIHRTMMKRWTNEDGDFWYSHKIGLDEWCHGAPGDVPEVPPKPIDNRHRYVNGAYSKLLQY